MILTWPMSVFRSPGVGLFAPSQPVVRPGPPRFAPESGFSPHLAQAAFLYGLTSTGNAPRLTPLGEAPYTKRILVVQFPSLTPLGSLVKTVKNLDSC